MAKKVTHEKLSPDPGGARRVGRPKGTATKFGSDGFVRLAVAIGPSEKAELETFARKLAAELDKRVSLGEAILTGVRDSGLYKRLMKARG